MKGFTADGGRGMLIITLLLATWLLCVPVLSHATIYFDDEMEEGTTLFNYQPNYDAGSYTYDTSVKFSGSGSIRLNFPAQCEPATFGGSGCGGSNHVSFPLTDEVYKRVYFRMSGAAGTPNPTSSGLFETSIHTFTKMLRTLSNGDQRQWWIMGCCSSKNWLVSVENAPLGSAFNRFSNKTFADNRWYCIETREKMNTPGVANGILQSWVDGTPVLDLQNITFRATGTNTQWQQTGIFRQSGRGSIWWDRMAVGNTRIGCIGSPPVSDTTPPTAPTSLEGS